MPTMMQVSSGLDSTLLAIDDVWIAIFNSLLIPDILACRQTCKRLMTISKLKTVWITACETHVIRQGFPFSNEPPSSMDMPDLERRTRRALRLGNQYRSSSCTVQRSITWRVNSSNAISNVHLLPGHGDRWLLTASKGIWCQISCWDLYPQGSRECKPYRVCDWGPKGVLFKSLAINSDCNSSVQLAVGITQNDETRIDLLSLFDVQGYTDPQFHVVKSLQCGFSPVTLQGVLLAASDDHARTKVIDCNTGAEALLQSSTDENLLHLEYNRCLQITFIPEHIFVVRARSVEKFPWPELLHQQEGTYVYAPIACHSFGWLNSIAVSLTAPSYQSMSLLFRHKSNDPWSQDSPTLDMYTIPVQPLQDTPDAAVPHQAFSPTLSIRIPVVRGLLRCTDLILRPHGTAVWISPHQSPATGLVQVEFQPLDAFQPSIASLHADSYGDCLMLGMFGETVGTVSAAERAKPLYWNLYNNWTSIDYSEELGRIVLGRADGLVTLLEL